MELIPKTSRQKTLGERVFGEETVGSRIYKGARNGFIYALLITSTIPLGHYMYRIHRGDFEQNKEVQEGLSSTIYNCITCHTYTPHKKE